MNARMRHSYFLPAALACTLLLLPASALAEPSPKPVFDLINQRLAQMEGVALYKAQHGLAVEDKSREKVVINRAQESAAAAGLDPSSVASFYQLQIQAAKAIQYRYLADWTFDQNATHQTATHQTAESLDTQIRPALIRLGDELVTAMKTFLESKGCFRADQLPLFLESITVEHLTEDEKKTLFESMSKIDLTHSLAHCAVSA